MAHVNYARGENREFVFRREGTHYSREGWGRRSIRRHMSRGGLGKRMQTLAGLGIRNWCPCCQDMNLHKRNGIKDPVSSRVINRLDRLNGKRQCQEGYDEWLEEAAEEGR